MRHRGRHVGNFHLVEKEGGEEFTGEDEEVLVLSPLPPTAGRVVRRFLFAVGHRGGWGCATRRVCRGMAGAVSSHPRARTHTERPCSISSTRVDG